MSLASAISKFYPQVVRVVGSENPIAYDENGNEVSYDLALVTDQAKKDANVAKAKALLASTDWATLSDVGLANSDEYVTYRGILRGLIIQPQAEFNFPTEPKPIWS
jgi:hypothetical protein